MVLVTYLNKFFFLKSH